MAQLTKVETETQIKSPPSKVYGFLKNNMSQLVHLLPQKFESIRVIEGTDGCVGNVKLCKVRMGEGTVTMKVRVEEINDKDMIIIHDAFEGDHTKLYNSLKSIVTVRNGSVKWGIEVEKAKDSAPDPDNFLTLSMEAAKAVDTYLLNH